MAIAGNGQLTAEQRRRPAGRHDQQLNLILRGRRGGVRDPQADIAVAHTSSGGHLARAVQFDRRRDRGLARGREPEFVSLSQFIREQQENRSAEQLLRPVDPWTVAREFYGDHNPSLYSVLAAIKAVPNVAQHELEANA